MFDNDERLEQSEEITTSEYEAEEQIHSKAEDEEPDEAISEENSATAAESDSGKKKKKRRIKKSDIVFLAIFNPILALIIAFAVVFIPYYKEYKTIFKDPSVYDNVFVAALGDKYQRLLSVNEQKIVVVGGSSVAFGLDSAALSEHTGMEVVNFGLYATLGSKVMLDLSEDGLNEGDIVIFAPELDSETMSLYFGARSAWQAIDANHDLYDTISAHNGQDLEDAKEEFITSKREYAEIGAPNPSGVYNRKNFNAYGDINYDRPYNTMAIGYDPNTTFSLSPDIISKDFLEYFNSYCARQRERGVSVYFSYCPINSLSLAEGVTDETVTEMDLYLRQNLACPVISVLDDYIMDWGYFYDTNLHLNNAGVMARTEMLANDIRLALGLGEEITMNVPAPPGLAPDDNGGENADSTYAFLFTYELHETPAGQVAYISGITEEGKAFVGKDITVPYYIDGYKVSGISHDAFAGLPKVEIIRLDVNIGFIEDAAFRGCPTLREIHIAFNADGCNVSPLLDNSQTGFMEGAPTECKIYCKDEYRQTFAADYSWEIYYSKYFAK